MRKVILAGLSAGALFSAPLFAGVASAAAGEVTTVTVTPANEANLGFSDEDDANGGTDTITATPPESGSSGPGYLELSTPDDSSKAALISYQQQNGRPLSDLRDVSYSTYRDSASTGAANVRPTAQIPIFRNGTTGFTSLIFEPLYCYGNSEFQDDTWQTFDGNHVEDGTLGCFHTSAAPDTYYKTLADVQAAFPDAVILGVGLNQGSSNAGLISRSDAETFVFNDGTTVYDFETGDRPPPPPALTASVSGGSVQEGNTGTTPLPFTVTLNRVSDTQTTIHFSTNNSSATSPSDYQGVTDGTLVIPAGETTGTMNIQVNGDTAVEGNEIFQLIISSTDADVTEANTASGTIVNDDTAGPPSKPSIKIFDATTMEGNSGQHQIRFPVRLGKATTVPVTVRYTTADGTAKSGSDYVSKTGTLTFQPGQTSMPILIAVKGDRVKEPSETFFVTLSGATNGHISDPNASGIIQNDD